jgi:hypothetical protein
LKIEKRYVSNLGNLLVDPGRDFEKVAAPERASVAMPAGVGGNPARVC